MSSDECAGVLINRFSFSFSNVSAAFNALFGSERTCTLTLAREELLAVIRLLSHASNYTQWQYFLFEQSGSAYLVGDCVADSNHSTSASQLQTQ